MIGRLTALAALFSVFAAATITYAAGALPAPPAGVVATAQPVRVIQLERVVVIAKRLPAQRP